MSTKNDYDYKSSRMNAPSSSSISSITSTNAPSPSDESDYKASAFSYMVSTQWPSADTVLSDRASTPPRSGNTTEEDDDDDDHKGRSNRRSQSLYSPSDAGDIDGDVTDTISGDTTHEREGEEDEDDEDDDFDYTTEGLSDQIAYLREKQTLLHRASLWLDQEQVYNAANAYSALKSGKEILESFAQETKKDPARCSITKNKAEREEADDEGSDDFFDDSSSSVWVQARKILNRKAPGRKSTPLVLNDKSCALLGSSVVISHNKSYSDISSSNKGYQPQKRVIQPADPRIDTSHVDKIIVMKPMTSCAQLDPHQLHWDHQDDDELRRHLQDAAMAPTPMMAGQWMAQALICSAPQPIIRPTNKCSDATNRFSNETTLMANATTGADTSNSLRSSNSSNENYKWRIVSDPSTFHLGLVPPRNMSLSHAVDMQEAVEITSEPRLITQSTPPFCVVFANKAFQQAYQFSEGSGVSTIVGPSWQFGEATNHSNSLENKTTSIYTPKSCDNSLIGVPVESILRIITPSMVAQPGNLGQEALESSPFIPQQSAVLCGIMSGGRPCCVQIAPVMDRSRRRRLSGDDTASSNSDTRYTSCMSHILIRILPSSTQGSHSSIDFVGQGTYPTATNGIKPDDPRTSVEVGTVG